MINIFKLLDSGQSLRSGLTDPRKQNKIRSTHINLLGRLFLVTVLKVQLVTLLRQIETDGLCRERNEKREKCDEALCSLCSHFHLNNMLESFSSSVDKNVLMIRRYVDEITFSKIICL